MVQLLRERDLPNLQSSLFESVITTTSQTSSAGATTSSVATPTSIPVLTSTVYVLEITPPAARDNPFIYHTGNMPDGTVFIAVGAIVGLIFIAILIWWCITTFISYRNTKEANALLNQHTYYNLEKAPLNDHPFNNDNNSNNNNRIVSDSSSMGKSNTDSYEFEEKYLHRDMAFDNGENDFEFGLRPEHQPFSIIQPDINSNSNNNMYFRQSLFISPTLQMAQRSQDIYQTPRRNSAISLDRPELTASPERKKKARSKHKRNQSSLGLLSASPSKSQLDLSTKANHRKSASVYLNDMLSGSIDSSNI